MHECALDQGRDTVGKLVRQQRMLRWCVVLWQHANLRVHWRAGFGCREGVCFEIDATKVPVRAPKGEVVDFYP